MNENGLSLLDFKWMMLKINLLPCYFKELDYFTENYISFINSIRQDTSNSNGHIDNLRKINRKVLSRISEIETFYEENIHDSKVVHFEKIRVGLKKLLQYDANVLNSLSERIIQQESKDKNVIKDKDKNKSKAMTNNISSPYSDKYNKSPRLKSQLTYKSINNSCSHKSIKSLSSAKINNNISNYDNNNKTNEVCYFKIVLSENEYKDLMKKKSYNVRI